MGKLFTTFALVVGLVAGSVSFAGADDWAINADFTDACSCNLSCPCVYGSPPTQGFCEGSGLVEVKKGHYGDVNLDGISAVVTYHMGGDGMWTKYYVSDNANDSQVKAMSKLVPATLGFLSGAEVRAVEKGPVTVNRTDSRVVFSGPASRVEIERVVGAGGQPIRVENLPAEGFPSAKLIDYTLYKSIETSHNAEKGGFSHTGRSAHTGRLEASSKN